MATASDDDINTFFGTSVTRRPNLWSQDDPTMGRIMVHHYQCHTIPILNDPSPGAFHKDASAEERIPHIIHFIWLGNKPIPPLSDFSTNDNEDGENQCIQSWRRHHPQWNIQVWSDTDIGELSFYNEKALKHALLHGNYGMASDIVRLELLYEHGGLYVDVDYFCVDSLQGLHDGSFDFYCGASNTGAIELNNGLMACQPHHGLIRAMMERIHSWFDEFTRQSQPFDLMSNFLDPESRAALHKVMTLSPTDVLRHTGPGLLTMTVAQALVDPSFNTDRLGILPYQVFHPLPNRFRGQSLNEQLMEEHMVPGQTKAVHLWACSWQ